MFLYCFDLEGRVVRSLSSPIVLLRLGLSSVTNFGGLQNSQLLLNLSDENFDNIEGLDAICVQVDLLIPGLKDVEQQTFSMTKTQHISAF